MRLSTKEIKKDWDERKTRGITLIALVITIVILIILAIISINAVLGENGLIRKAEQAKEVYERTRANEENNLMLELEKMIQANKNTWTGEIATSYARGEGTEADPYIIESPEELAYLAKTVNEGATYEGEYIKITNSMSLSKIKWTPIAKGTDSKDNIKNWTMEKTFKGTIDGENNIIINVCIEELDDWGVGLIGVLDVEGTIKNLKIMSGEVKGQTCVGGIVGANKGTIENCENRANIIAIDKENVTNTGEEAGGIVGHINGGTIRECANYGKVTTKDNNQKTGRGKCAGGIVGIIKNEAIIEKCQNYGVIVAEYQYVGGIAGCIGNGTIRECTNDGKVTAKVTTNVENSGTGSGGIVGGIKGEATIEKCQNHGEIVAERQIAGGIVGDIYISTSGDIGNGTIRECTNYGKVTAKVITNVANSGTYSGGIVGVIKNEAIIEKCQNHGEIVAEKQIAGGIVGDIYISTSGDIGNGTIRECTNYGKVTAKVITNVANSGTYSGGIVGYIKGEGTIEKCQNHGEIVAEIQIVGGIAGRVDNGTIKECTNYGKVTAKVITNVANSGTYSGGMVGVINGEGTIEKCQNHGEIVAERRIVGGIVGSIEVNGNGTIRECANAGEVTANATEGKGIAGGIIGVNRNGLNVEECYNKGKVEVADYEGVVDVAGGIGGFINRGSIKYCYNEGEVVGEAVGGIIGQYNNTTVAEIVKNYYTNIGINGIGSEGADNSVVTIKNDIVDVVEKTTDMLNSYEAYVEWIAMKK